MLNFRTPPAPLDRRDALLGLLLFLVAYVLLSAAPVTTVGDSKYSLLLTQNLLSKGSFVLDGHGIPRKPEVVVGLAHLNGDTYQLEIVDDHLYSYFPPGSSILSAPFVLLADAFGQSVVRPDGTYDAHREKAVQRFIADTLMAFLTVIFYVTARLALPLVWSAVVALGGTLGTQVWSTASRALWTHTWGVSLVGFALLLLFAHETGRRRLSPVLLATVLSWTYFVRPTNSVFILGFTAYLLLYHRAAFPAYAATGAAWFVAFVAYSSFHFGHLLPSYYQAARLSTETLWEALAGNLVSPSRGLFVYVPVLLFVFYLLARHRRHQPCPRLAALAAAMGALHLLAVSCFVPWYGGWCYGPRYTTELVPWFVLLAILGLRAALDRRDEPGLAEKKAAASLPGLTVGAALLLVSVAINARGAYVWRTFEWNQFPVEVDLEPARVWDWRHPQILAGLGPEPLPAEFPRLEGSRIAFGQEAGRAFQFDGWSTTSDPGFCWTDGKRATLLFATDDPTPDCLRLRFGCFLHGTKLRRQRVDIRLNDQPVAGLTVDQPGARDYTFALPAGALRRKNVLVFSLPDAASPKSLSARQTDDRTLGVALSWLELGRAAKPPGP